MLHDSSAPDASIIIPCHNDGRRLPIALASFTSQDTDLNLEIVVVDDASTEPIEPICRQYGARYIRGEWHNADSARNVGISSSTAPIVFFFDADNCPNVDYVRRLAEPIIADQADVVYSKRTFIGEKRSFDFDYFNKLTVRHEDLKMGAQIDTACAVRRKFLSSEIWDPELVRGQDWDFHLKLLAQGARYELIDEALWRYWLKPAALINQADLDCRYITSHDTIRQKHDLQTAGSADLTIATRLLPKIITIKRSLERILKITRSRRKLSTNLHLILDSPTHELFNDLVIPWLKKYRHLFSGSHVTLEPDLFRDRESILIRCLELHLESTTTKKVMIFGQEDYPVSWLRKPRPVITEQLRQVHLLSTTEVRKKQLNALNREIVDEQAPRVIFVLYDIKDPSDILPLTGRIVGYEKTSQLVLFAHDHASHQKILHTDLPSGCWLPAWNKNRARVMNQLLNEDVEMIVVMCARLWLPPWFISNTYQKLRDDFIITGQTYWHGGSLASSRYDIDQARLDSGPATDDNHLQLINPYLFAINPKRVTKPLFEPRFADNWPSMIIDTSFRLARDNIVPTNHVDWQAVYPAQASDLPQPSPRLMAECLSLNTPWKQVSKWCWSGSWPVSSGGVGSRHERYRGLINDWLMRWREPEKRRLWRPL